MIPKLVLVCFLSTLSVTAAAQGGLSGEQLIQQLGWLEGRWRGTFGNLPYEEYYSSPEGGQVLWFSKLFRDGRVIAFEFGTFELQEDRLVYVPYPSGRKKPPFSVLEIDGVGRAVFENRENDFPTRFTFELTGPGQLQITLTGPDAEKGRVQRIRLTKQ